MNKFLNFVSNVATIGTLCLTTYYLLEKKKSKDMIDVLIEEIETVK